MAASTLPVLVDADHGYGNALNVRRTIEELEVAGAAGLTIEECLNPPVIWEKERGWYTTQPFSAAKLFFAYGLGNGGYFPMSVGAQGVLYPHRPMPEPMFELIARYRPTIFFGVPTLASPPRVEDLNLRPPRIAAPGSRTSSPSSTTTASRAMT